MQRTHLILSATLIAVIGALVWRAQRASSPAATAPSPSLEASEERSRAEIQWPPAKEQAHAVSAAPVEVPAKQVARALPRLVELGSDSCVSCKAMVPVLAELRTAHEGELEVEFIDVWKFPERGKPFDLRVIPTQVFLAPDGTELARHEGFYAASAIRERWAELGIEFPSESVAQ